MTTATHTPVARAERVGALKMVNIGVMSLSQLTSIVSQFDQIAGNKIAHDKSDILWTLSLTGKDTVVLSAARIDNDAWHVRAREGMIIAG